MVDYSTKSVAVYDCSLRLLACFARADEVGCLVNFFYHNFMMARNRLDNIKINAYRDIQVVY